MLFSLIILLPHYSWTHNSPCIKYNEINRCIKIIGSWVYGRIGCEGVARSWPQLRTAAGSSWHSYLWWYTDSFFSCFTGTGKYMFYFRCFKLKMKCYIPMLKEIFFHESFNSSYRSAAILLWLMYINLFTWITRVWLLSCVYPLV